jgi:hypothetical protein
MTLKIIGEEPMSTFSYSSDIPNLIEVGQADLAEWQESSACFLGEAH